MFVWRIYEYPLILEKKKAKINNSGQFRGSFAAMKVHATAWHVQATAWPRRGSFHPRVCRDEATVHSMKNVVFYFVLLFRYSKDLSIRLMRIL